MQKKTEPALIEAAKSGDETAFRTLLEPSARELHVYAYRLLGGFQDAEDALQETRLKAWKNLAAYEPETTFRAWLYRIATNTCLDMLKSRRRRMLPQDMGAPVEPGPPTTERRDDIPWLEPYPDALLPIARDPETAARLRESVRLAFVRAMQVLPARQRAALILHDVLDWSVSEVATILDTSDAAINSALQRARATIARPGEGGGERLEAKKSEAIALFVEAWETGNLDRFVSMLTEDAILSMPPWIYWLDGRDAVAAGLRNQETWEGELREGRYRIVSTTMNGDPAALAYIRGEDGRYTAVCMTVLGFDSEGMVSELTVFVLPSLFVQWGYPTTLD